MDYKNTVNLPRTDFPMKADLVAREPQRLAKWTEQGLYQRIQAARANSPKFVLHDGPPFANGDVHVGTALNKILKDIVVKYKAVRGYSAPYIPGWDCHGLPIEFKVGQEMRKAGNTEADAASIRRACDAYARNYIDLQRTQFKRLGVLGDWENPYLTLNPEYEANELRLFADVVEKGFVYRGKKPVYWSIPCRTALAEAEVEYEDHISQSIYVKFPVVGQPGTYILIWTTTPWTLPANLAVAFNSQFHYSLVMAQGETFLVSNSLLSQVSTKAGWDAYQIIRTVYGDELATLEYQHPFCNRTGKLLAGDDFVENSTGTGFVHIAPGHGLEDYGLGMKHGLPVYSPVNDEGVLAPTADLPAEAQMPASLIGKSVLEKGGKSSEANETVLAILRESQRLLVHEPYSHQYPHCWRSKTPVVFRAMDQWFIRIDHSVQPGQSFRQQALAEIDRVKWVPDWGSNRIRGAVEGRPDWCISRQRTWGVPIPAFYDAQGNAILNAAVVRRAADVVAKEGGQVWFEKTAQELWALCRPPGWTGAEAVAKSMDTLDVWIDSGSSSRAVIAQRKELHGPRADGTALPAFQADLYLEGSDQHRGWFQSSLLLSLAGNGAAPFRTVLTHGFMVDADREKISKSKQGQSGYEKPQTAERYVKEFGADVLRLWVASQDFRNDIVVSEERIKKVGETYRLIRNALRYQLSNLYDFDPRTQAVPEDQLTGLDRWILGEFAALETDVLKAYEAYEFHVVYQRLSQFVAVELSAVYHDVVKDRLYTDAAHSLRRRSTQTALARLVTGLCQMLSPILAFTGDEAWEFIPGRSLDSVHESLWKQTAFAFGEAERQLWQKLFAVRDQALPVLEQARQAKTLGKALEARLEARVPADWVAPLTPVASQLQELLNVSQLILKAAAPTETSSTSSITVQVTKADGIKCERCWHWETHVGQCAEHPTLCARCVEAVKALPQVPS